MLSSSAFERDLLDLRRHLLGLQVELAWLKLSRALLKYDPNQPRVPSGEPGGGQWTDADGSRSPQGIIAIARRMNLAARPDAYQRCLDLCYPLLERRQAPGSDRNTWDFHKCMNACLKRDLDGG